MRDALIAEAGNFGIMMPDIASGPLSLQVYGIVMGRAGSHAAFPAGGFPLLL